MATERKPTDRLGNRTGTHMQKSTASYSGKGGRNATSRTLAMGLCNSVKRRNITKNRTHIQNVRYGTVSCKEIHQ